MTEDELKAIGERIVEEAERLILENAKMKETLERVQSFLNGLQTIRASFIEKGASFGYKPEPNGLSPDQKKRVEERMNTYGLNLHHSYAVQLTEALTGERDDD